MNSFQNCLPDNNEATLYTTWWKFRSKLTSSPCVTLINIINNIDSWLFISNYFTTRSKGQVHATVISDNLSSELNFWPLYRNGIEFRIVVTWIGPESGSGIPKSDWDEVNRPSRVWANGVQWRDLTNPGQICRISPPYSGIFVFEWYKLPRSGPEFDGLLQTKPTSTCPLT